jgi:hypothetical protein
MSDNQLEFWVVCWWFFTFLLIYPLWKQLILLVLDDLISFWQYLPGVQHADGATFIKNAINLINI